MTGIAFPTARRWAVVLFLAFHLVVVLLEEPGLKKRFGDSYAVAGIERPIDSLGIDDRRAVKRLRPRLIG